MQKVFDTADSIFIPTNASTIVNVNEIVNLEENFRVRHTAGIAVGEFGVLDSSLGEQIADSISAQAMSTSLGEWIAVAESSREKGNSYLAFADSYGYAPLFYSLIPGRGFIISGSFNGVVGALADRGCPSHLNIDNYIATLASWRTQFATPRPNMTMAKEIRILPVDKAVLIDSSSVREVPRSAISFHLGQMSYTELLEAGNQFVEKVVTEVGKLSDISRGLSLSGGVDSRLVLSLIIKAGMKDAYQLHTSDPRDYSNAYTRKIYARDAAIANEIRDHYGMKWMTRSASRSIPLSFRESLLAHQSFRSNFSYSFSPIKRAGLLENPTVTLRGGGGEILRSTSTGWGVAAAVEKEAGLIGAGTSDQFLWWYMENGNWSNIFDNRIASFVHDGFSEVGGESLVEKLNNYYLMTRNRCHFGHARASRSRNEIPLQFLSNIYYLEASKKIPFQEKAEGRIVADIFSATTPDLLNFPFESPEWHSRLASSKAKPYVEDEEAWRAEFDSLKKLKGLSANNFAWGPGVRGENSNYDAEAACLFYIKSSFQLIEQLSGEKELALFHKQMWAGLRAGKLKLGTLVSKVASAVDVYFPSVGSGVNLSLPTSQTSVIGTFDSAVVAAPVIVHDGWNNISTPELSPKLHLNGESIFIDAQPSMIAEGGVSYAFYLYKDGERVETSWYGPETRRVFKMPLEEGTYHGRVFLKLPHLNKAVLIRETESVVFSGDGQGN